MSDVVALLLIIMFIHLILIGYWIFMGKRIQTMSKSSKESKESKSS